jgi:hypothetical protein
MSTESPSAFESGHPWFSEPIDANDPQYPTGNEGTTGVSTATDGGAPVQLFLWLLLYSARKVLWGGSLV